MQYIDLWKALHGSVCSITHFKGAEKLGSGTGFKIGRYIITNNHVYRDPNLPSTHVEIRFVGDDGYSEVVSKKFPIDIFSNLLTDGEPKDSWDYAILNIEYVPEFQKITSLEIEESEKIQIGQSIVLFGFHFEHPNLSIHTGIISSRFFQVPTGVKYLQIDASVNNGNSGGPLLSIESRKVIGIITRKATGLTKAFEDLESSFEGNLEALSRSRATMMIGGIDPVEGFKITQNQLKSVAKEIKRSANVGIGYAYEMSKIIESLKRNS